MSRILRPVALSLVFLGISSAQASASAPAEAERECLIQARFAHPADLAYASKLAIESIDEGAALAPSMRVRCSKIDEIASFAQHYKIVDADLGATIRAEKERIQRWNTQYASDVTSPQHRFQDYLNLKQIRSVVDSWVEEFPDYVHLETIGASVQGRPIRAVHISRFKGDKAPKHRTIILGGHHAREWLAHATTLCITERFIRGIENPNSRHHKILSNMTLSVIPMGNPDGYQISHDDNRMQRKNANEVDLNRNWDIAWKTQGESVASKGDENYPGTSAWSEPETAAYRDFIQKYATGLKGFFDIHAFIPAIMAPYGYRNGVHPKAKEYNKVMKIMADAMDGPGMQRYETGAINELVGLASGSSADWVDDVTDALSFGTEIRGESFVMPASQIKPSCDENEAALLAFFEAVIPQQGNPENPNESEASTSDSDSGGPDDPDENEVDPDNQAPDPQENKGGCTSTSHPSNYGVLLLAALCFLRRRYTNPA